MQINSKEHYELMVQFEKQYRGLRMDREKDKSLWEKGHVYESGETNQLFRAFRNGYAFGRAVESA